MKKKLILIVVTIWVMMAASVITTPLSAQAIKGISIYAGGGVAFSDLEGPVLNLGLELDVSERFGIHLVMDYLLNPLPDLEVDGIEYTVIGSGIMGAFKFVSKEKVKVFVRAGIHLSAFRAKFGAFTTSDSDFGIAGGLGLKYALGERLGLMLGGDVKVLFDSGDTVNYFNTYVGLSYRFGGSSD